jgi:hypothetical protein
MGCFSTKSTSAWLPPSAPTHGARRRAALAYFAVGGVPEEFGT